MRTQPGEAMHTTMQAPAQYSLAQILGLWAAAALPMAFLGWVATPVVAPWLDPRVGVKGTPRFLLMTGGLIWQCLLALLIVYREGGSLRWATLKARCWLQTPRDPRTGAPRRLLWLWLVLFVPLFPALAFTVSPVLNTLWVSLFPFLAEPPAYSASAFLSSPETRAHLVGAWWFFGLFLVLAVFNTVLGEEFLFRGVLLPKMQGVFGQWDWVVNGVLFGAYHVHQPWGILGGCVDSIVVLALPAKLFRSTWLAMIVHSGQSVFVGVLILRLVLG